MKYLILISSFVLLANNLQSEPAPYMPAGSPPFAVTEDNGPIGIEEFLSLTPNKIKEKTGQRLTLKQVFILKKTQKKIKKHLREQGVEDNGKSQVTALFLAIFLGFVGAHRFYLGYTFHGFFYLLTAGGCYIMAIIDLILIATGNLQPKYGPYTESLD